MWVFKAPEFTQTSPDHGHLDLQPEVEAQLTAEAHACGIALERLIEQMSHTQFEADREERLKSRTVAEAVERILHLREETNLDGLKIKDLISAKSTSRTST